MLTPSHAIVHTLGRHVPSVARRLFARAQLVAALALFPAMLGVRGCEATPSERECGSTATDPCPLDQLCFADFEGSPTAHCRPRPIEPDCGVYPDGGPDEDRDGGVAPGATCGGLLGIGCEGGQFCDFAPSTVCGAGDQSGTCRTPSAVCTEEWAPVCGCDGATYGNACTAAGARVSVLHVGACDCLPPPCAAPPPGCAYVGGSQCECGTLVCAQICEPVSVNVPPGYVIQEPCTSANEGQYICPTWGTGFECTGGCWSGFYDGPCFTAPPGTGP